MEHTPAPWEAYKRPEPVGHAEWEIHFGNDQECVAEVVHGAEDARLMAAAPELLEALEECMLINKKLNPQAYRKARKAIAKAKGEA